MSEKLKTLKDLPHSEIEFKKYHKEIMIPKRELKAEAIKDIKAILSMKKTLHDLMYGKMTGNYLTYSEEGKQTIINYIKWKFNLTEEDLKDE